MRELLIGIVISYFLLLLPSGSSASSIAKDVQEGNRLYEEEKYREAVEMYNKAREESPESDIVHYNLGAALYKEGKYREAIEAMTKALNTENRKIEAKAVYNLANSKYKLGSQMANTDLNSAINMYRESLDYYKRAIELDESDKEARHNHELVERHLKVLLDRLKNQQQHQGEKENQQDDQESRQSQADSEQEEKSEKKQEQHHEQEGDDQKESGPENGKDRAASEEEGKETQPAATGEDDSKEMSPEEARMLLEAYGQEEAREDIKNRRKGPVRGVQKDW